jgi:hypothetical protein
MHDAIATKTKALQYDYRETLAASQRVNWRIEDMTGSDKRKENGLKKLRPFFANQ